MGSYWGQQDALTPRIGAKSRRFRRGLDAEWTVDEQANLAGKQVI
jgi:hypothetical protein